MNDRRGSSLTNPFRLPPRGRRSALPRLLSALLAFACGDARAIDHAEGGHAAAPEPVIERNIAVPMRDGTLLRADIYRPAAAGRYATLVYRTPYGKDVLKGVKDGLGAAGAKMIVKEATYEVTDPTIDSQILTLQGSGADTFIDITTAMPAPLYPATAVIVPPFDRAIGSSVGSPSLSSAQ